MTSGPWRAPFARGPVHAELSLPGSKSLTNRALVLAALADGPSVVRRALRSRDTELMAGALAALGTRIDTSGDDWHVTPAALTGGVAVDCGLAGTVTRFVPPVAALADGDVAFDGDPHMRTRPVGEVLTALRALGVRVDGDAPAVHGGRHRARARRQGRARRLGLQPVRLRPAARRVRASTRASTSSTTASPSRPSPTST